MPKMRFQGESLYEFTSYACYFLGIVDDMVQYVFGLSEAGQILAWHHFAKEKDLFWQHFDLALEDFIRSSDNRQIWKFS